MNAQDQLKYLYEHVNFPATNVIATLCSEASEQLEDLYSIEWIDNVSWGTDYTGKPVRAIKSFYLPVLGKFVIRRAVVLHWCEYTLIFIETTSDDTMLLLHDADTGTVSYVATYSPTALDELLNLEGLTVNTL